MPLHAPIGGAPPWGPHPELPTAEHYAGMQISQKQALLPHETNKINTRLFGRRASHAKRRLHALRPSRALCTRC